MFCSNCGSQCKDNARFCSKCGAELRSNVRMPRPENISPAQAYIPESSANADADIRDTKKKKGLIVAVIVIIIAAALAVAAFFVLKNPISEKQFQSHMEAGQTYLEEAAYEEAVDEFEAAIDIQSDAVEPYRLMAQAYIGLDDSENVESTYDTIRGIIVTHYETSEENELLEDSKELYVDAIDYYGEQEDADTVEELAEEIVPMLTEDEDVEEIEELSEQWIQQIEEGADEEDDSFSQAENDVEEWRQLYAAYLQEAEVSVTNYTGEGSYYLIYLNDDDIPELFYYASAFAESSCLYYIRDGEVMAQEMNNAMAGMRFAERDGYISANLYQMESGVEEAFYWDGYDVMEQIFYGSFGYTGPLTDDPQYYLYEYGPVGYSYYELDGESVTEEEYLDAHSTAFSWRTEDTYEIVDLFDETAFAQGTSAAIEYLSDGE